MKKGIRYLRFSDPKQSNGSIERQDLYTEHWMMANKVEVVDTFIDRGRSARTFNRPDFKKLQDFIRRHHNKVDYLVVDQLDRFSRDAGDAIKLVRDLQKLYSIQIVSVTEGIIYDYSTPGSFFRTGLQLLLAEEDNINRSIKVRGGIYTAKAREGRFIYRSAPFGYRKQGERKERGLVIYEPEAIVIRYIYSEFLRGTPLYLIEREAKRLGFDRKGNSSIKRVLQNPVYAGLQNVEAFMDYPGGLFPANHCPIIDKQQWEAVRRKLIRPARERVTLSDEIPLRGVLRCHCGRLLTGAPSRGKSGKYFYYYKCGKARHLNLSAKKAHQQLEIKLQHIRFPKELINRVIAEAIELTSSIFEDDTLLIAEKKKILKSLDAKQKSLEEKWISDLIPNQTFLSWKEKLDKERQAIITSLRTLGKNPESISSGLIAKINGITNMLSLYKRADTAQKQQLLEQIFCGNLYYSCNDFHCPTIFEVLL